eukprot:Nk52_evm41s2496 gene=Nk52_evmTU41s2496
MIGEEDQSRDRTSSNLSDSSQTSQTSQSSQSILAGLYPEILEFSIHLSEKVVHDAEPVEGYVCLTLAEDMDNYVEDVIIALRATLCYRLEDGSPYESLLHEVIQRGSVPFVGGMPAGNYEYPFSFNVKEDLPPSLIMTSMMDHRPILVVKYEVRAYAMHQEDNPLNRLHLRSIATMIRKKSVPIPKEIKALPSASNSRTFAFGGNNPLSMTATLTKHVFQRGEPIAVKIHVDNQSSKKVYALRLSAKQIVDVAVCPGSSNGSNGNSNEEQKTYSHKQHLAVVEDFDDCPIKKGQVVDTVMQFRPEDVFAYGLALTMEASDDRRGDIVPTCNPVGSEYVSVHYYLNIHCCVHLAADLIVTLPFVILEKPALPEGLRDHPPAYYSSQFDNNFESASPQSLLDAIHPFGMSAEERAQRRPDSTSLGVVKDHAVLAELQRQQQYSGRRQSPPPYEDALRRPSLFTKLEDVPTMSRRSSNRRSRRETLRNSTNRNSISSPRS